jgi:anaerobic magnesium-protoporphyrin IX monomethyl ester cyclase
MDLILINPGNFQFNKRTEHLGIACLKSYIASKDYNVDMIDLSLEEKTLSQLIRELMAINPAMIGFSLLNETVHNGIKIIRGLRKKGFTGKIVVGGYFATFSSKELLSDFREIDYVVRGEGEITLEELLNFEIRRQGYPEAIAGLSYRNEDDIIENPSRPLIEDLDILPPPDRKYANVVMEQKSPLRLYGTRGCWGQCSFCDIVGLYGISKGKAWRRRSAKNLVDEIALLHQQYNTSHFIFNDDQFLVKGRKAIEYVEEFASELEKRSLNIKFELMCRADTVKKDVMLRLQSVGLQRVFLGLESFDPKQLARFKKNISVRQNLKAVITLYQLKIDVIASVILADAFTTLWDLLRQFMIIFQLKSRYFNSRHCQISINKKLEIYRGGSVYNEYKQKGILTKDHYLNGIDYNLKLWTGLRIKMLVIEEYISRAIYKPNVVIDQIKQSVKYKLALLR